jgi:hypothetical protein
VQYFGLLDILSQQTSVRTEQRLSIVYYLILQNRISEAIEHFGKIDSADYACKLQHDYFATYFDMIQGRFDAAETRAAKYADYPNTRWRDWFRQVQQHLAERKALQSGTKIASVDRDDWKTDSGNRILSGGRDQQNANESDALPSLELVQEGDQVVVRYRNLSEFDVNFYVMDVELQFSRNPFAQQESSRLNTIEPNVQKQEKVKSSSETAVYTIDLPENLRNKNIGIEVVGSGLTRRMDHHVNSMIVNLSPNTGRLQVLSKEGMQPLEGSYVKVYAKMNDGSAIFFKDGYTDLRGQFDYASVSTDDLKRTVKLSILVLHDKHGASSHETDPPKQ